MARRGTFIGEGRGTRSLVVAGVAVAAFALGGCGDYRQTNPSPSPKTGTTKDMATSQAVEIYTNPNLVGAFGERSSIGGIFLQVKDKSTNKPVGDFELACSAGEIHAIDNTTFMGGNELIMKGMINKFCDGNKMIPAFFAQDPTFVGKVVMTAQAAQNKTAS